MLKPARDPRQGRGGICMRMDAVKAAVRDGRIYLSVAK
jgi:hypothetical protein